MCGITVATRTMHVIDRVLPKLAKPYYPFPEWHLQLREHRQHRPSKVLLHIRCLLPDARPR